MVITKQFLKEFRLELKEAVKELEAKHKCKVELGNISYTEDSFTSKMTVSDASISASDREKKEFEKFCMIYGFEAKDYLKEFTLQGKNFVLYGFKPKATKNTCKIREVSTGKDYMCPESTVNKTK